MNFKWGRMRRNKCLLELFIDWNMNELTLVRLIVALIKTTEEYFKQMNFPCRGFLRSYKLIIQGSTSVILMSWIIEDAPRIKKILFNWF